VPLLTAPAALAPDDLDGIAECYDTNGFVRVGGVVPDELIERIGIECADAQVRLVRGELDARYGTDVLDDPGAQVGGVAFAHYVCYSTEVSPAAHEAAHLPFFATVAQRLLVEDGGATQEPWLLDYERFGVVFQQSRQRVEAGCRCPWAATTSCSSSTSSPTSTPWPGTRSASPTLSWPTSPARVPAPRAQPSPSSTTSSPASMHGLGGSPAG